MKSKFYFKRGKAASWAEQNILLGPGEPGFELDTGKLKVGNGVDKWNDLPYINADPVEVENGAYFIAATGSLPTGFMTMRRMAISVYLMEFFMCARVATGKNWKIALAQLRS